MFRIARTFMKGSFLSFTSILISAVLAVPPVSAVTVDPIRDPNRGTAAVGAQSLSPASFKLNVVVTQSDRELGGWLDLSEQQRARKRRIKEFVPNQKGSVALVLTGLRMDELEAAGLVAQIQLYGPDGRLLYSHPDVARSAWGRPKKGYLALLPEVNFTFDQADRSGFYTYRATVTDLYNTTIARAEEKILLVN